MNMLISDRNRKLIFTLVIFFIISFSVISAQETLKSTEEEYYDFLALQGFTERPTLNYRTLSDSVWTIKEGASHPWENQNLGTKRRLFDLLDLKIYGPELFNSINTAAPYGQNDGALWQGKGYNLSLTAGARLEAYGFELTYKPQLSFSQNAAFDFIRPSPEYAAYTDRGAVYGYYGVPYVDAPQRFGDRPLFTYDWGDSEIRYTWKTLTLGFGTQAIWLGPAQINPIIHSNNAPTYPKFDIGLRKQSILIPKVNWYLGDIETRAWWGYLSESDYFDNDTSNDHNLITGFTIAYTPPFLRRLSLGFNRIMLSKWGQKSNYKTIFTLLLPEMISDAGFDENDQRASVTIDYLLPIAGLNIYLEWGRNDYQGEFNPFLRYPFHTEGYTVGVKKSLNFKNSFRGEILLELTNLENSRDYDRIIPWYATFYSHHLVTQGHTNRGQWMGAGIGTGGNSQYLGFKLYFPRGNGQFFVQRRNPDLDYSWYIDSRNNPGAPAEMGYRMFLDFGLSGLYYLNKYLSLTGSLVIRDEQNPLNASNADYSPVHRVNAYISMGLKFKF
ncbi:hypothetical protein AGMMS50268_01370 [Spirochaetia bacterium]|nr:hypothetical protein AGMMS50268_01370 [Spirochaetia bacterium]